MTRQMLADLARLCGAMRLGLVVVSLLLYAVPFAAEAQPAATIPAAPIPDMEGRLVVDDESRAIQALAALAKRVGATDFAVTREDNETVVRMSVTRKAFWGDGGRFWWTDVRRIGAYRPDYEGADPHRTDPVRVLLRLRSTGLFYRK
jgi:hypothetical protein